MSFFRSRRTLIIIAACLTLPVIALSANERISETSSQAPKKRVAAPNPDEIFNGAVTGADEPGGGSSDSSAAASGSEGPLGSGNGAGQTGTQGSDTAGASPGKTTAGGAISAGGGSPGPTGTTGGTTKTKSIYEMTSLEIVTARYQEIGAQDQMIIATIAAFKADVADGKPTALNVKLARELLGRVVAEKQEIYFEGLLVDAPHKANHDQMTQLADLNEIRAFAILQAYTASQDGANYRSRLTEEHNAKVEYDSLYPGAAPP